VRVCEERSVAQQQVGSFNRLTSRTGRVKADFRKETVFCRYAGIHHCVVAFCSSDRYRPVGRIHEYAWMTVENPNDIKPLADLPQQDLRHLDVGTMTIFSVIIERVEIDGVGVVLENECLGGRICDCEEDTIGAFDLCDGFESELANALYPRADDDETAWADTDWRDRGRANPLLWRAVKVKERGSDSERRRHLCCGESKRDLYLYPRWWTHKLALSAGTESGRDVLGSNRSI
jgi:hypothetical protein